MARSRSRAGSRQMKATSRKRSPAADNQVEVVEEAEGLGMESGIAVVTAVILLVAWGFVDYALGTLYGQGWLFK